MKRVFEFLDLSNCQTVSFYKAPEKSFGASKDFQLHPHKNFDMIKTELASSPLSMSFYSTQFSDSNTIEYLGILLRRNSRKENKPKRYQMASI